jgi:hypothetical protein
MERLQQLVGSRSKYSNMTVDTPCKPLVSAWMGGSAALVAALDHDKRDDDGADRVQPGGLARAHERLPRPGHEAAGARRLADRAWAIASAL